MMQCKLGDLRVEELRRKTQECQQQQQQHSSVITTTIDITDDDNVGKEVEEEENEEEEEQVLDLLKKKKKKKSVQNVKEYAKMTVEDANKLYPFTVSDYIFQLWNESISVLRNIRLMVAGLSSYATDIKRTDAYKEREVLRMRDLLRDIYIFWLPIEAEYCARIDVEDYLKRKIPSEKHMVYFVKGTMTEDMINATGLHYIAYVEDLAEKLLKRKKEKENNLNASERNDDEAAEMMNTSPLLLHQLTSVPSQQTKSAAVPITINVSSQQQTEPVAVPMTIAELRAETRHLDDNMDVVGDDDDDVDGNANKQKIKKIIFGSAKRKGKNEEEEMRNTRKRKNKMIEENTSSYGVDVETLNDIPESFSQFIALQNDTGAMNTLKTPGERGEEIVRMQLYKTNDILGKEQRNWWRYSTARTQFIITNSAADQTKKLLVRNLFDRVTADIKNISGVVREVRSFVTDIT